MVAFAADPRPIYWKNPRGDEGHFRGEGKMILVGSPDDIDYRRNPKRWGSTESILSARLFVGFNVGTTRPEDAKAEAERLVELVKRVRLTQGQSPNASFLMQLGIYRYVRTGEIVTEDGAQVIILDTEHTPPESFEQDIVALAEEIAREFQQEEVIMELQRGGLHVSTHGIGP